MLLFTFLLLTAIVSAAALVVDIVIGSLVLFVIFGDAFVCIVIVILIIRFLRWATRWI